MNVSSSTPWGVCADPMIVLDVAHWQGTAMDLVTARDLGVEALIAKVWHGRSIVLSGDVQIEAGRAAGLDTLGTYGWLLQDADLDMQVGAWTGRRRERDELPLMVDFEDPDTKLRGRSLIMRAEYAVEKISDRLGCRPLFYTGEWYMRGFCSDAANPFGIDSEILGDCPLVLPAYPRKATTGTRYREAVAEVCGGIMPKVPLIWAQRGIQPIMWQFDGNGGLYLPMGKDGSKPDVDVNAASRSRLRALRLESQRDTDPAPAPDEAPTQPSTPTSKSSQHMQAVREPGLQLGDERRTEWSHKIDRPTED